MARPTRQGISTIVVGLIAVAVGRVFGIRELYVIAAALFILPLGAWLFLSLRPSQLDVDRRIHPRMVEAGTRGRVRLDIHNQAVSSSPLATFTDPIGTIDSATVELGRLKGKGSIAAVYQVPTQTRGVIHVGPMTMSRTDPFRLARRSQIAAAQDELVVTPTTFALNPPSDSSGPLGTHMRSVAQRLGRGDFHSLRDYVVGDELRSVHWKASARSDDLKVKQHDRQLLENCTVVLDVRELSYPAPQAGSHQSAPAFERAVSCAASIVAAAHLADLNTRFVAGPTIDHRGPDVLADTLASLARVEVVAGSDASADVPSTPTVLEQGDGLGLLVIVSASHAAAASLSPTKRRPGTTQVFVCTVEASHVWNSVDATSLVDFQTNWDSMVGQPGAVRQPLEATS